MPIDYTNSANQVRARINDRVRFEAETFIGDGSASAFKLKAGAPFSTVTAATAYVFVAATPGYSATAATFDVEWGRVGFAGSVSANSGVQATYGWSIFADDEINYYLYTAAGGGSVPAVALLCVKALQFDSLRRASWGAPDGTNYDDTAAQATLQKMYDSIWAELREGPDGGIESWSEQQENYSGSYSG